MKKLFAIVVAGLFSSLALAQTYPSPTFNSLTLQNPLSAANGGTGATSSSGTGSAVLNNGPTLIAPNLGTPSAVNLTNGTGLPISTGISGFGTGVAAALSNAVTGSGSPVLATSPSIVSPTVTGAFTATGLVTTADLATQSANTVLANVTGSNASPTAFAMPSCSTTSSALTWTSGAGFACNAAINASQLGGATFAAPGSIGSTTPNTGAFTSLSASGTVSGTGFSNYLASPPAIGGATASAGTFTTLTANTAALGTNTTQAATTAFVVNHQGCKNILDYGGNNIGGGAAANNTAWTNAISAQSANNSVCIYFPPGSYLFNSTISYAIPNLGSTITIIGDGSSVTNLVWPNAVNGIVLTTKDWTSSIHVRGLTLQTQGAGTATGLTITQGAGSISNPANTAQSDITDVTFMGSDGWTSGGPTSGTKYWVTGTQVTAVSNINYVSDMWLGAFGSGTGLGNGVVLSGSSSTQAAVVHNFTGCNFIFNNVSITMGTWVQGVSLTSTNLTEVNQGVVANGTAGMVQLAVTNSQFSTYSNDIVIGGPLTNASITNNLFYVGGSNSGIIINSASAADFNIANNQFFPGFSAASPNGVFVNVSNSGSSNYLGENIFNSLGTGVTLTSNAPSWTLGANSFAGVTTNYSIGTQSVNYTSYHAIGGGSFGTAIPTSSTYYVGTAGANANIGQNQQVISQVGTLAKLTVQAYATVGAGQSWVATVYLNGVATSMTCTISGSSNAVCQDFTHTVALASASDITVGVTTSSGATVTGVMWSALVVH
jgi:hypothetical protein